MTKGFNKKTKIHNNMRTNRSIDSHQALNRLKKLGNESFQNDESP